MRRKHTLSESNLPGPDEVGQTRGTRFLQSEGEMAARIWMFDWGRTALGRIEDWPQSLKTATGFVIHSAVPMVMLWGADGYMIYNDAYSVFAGKAHPRLLGSKVVEGWPEVADFNRHVLATCLNGGTLKYRDEELALDRSGGLKPAWLDLDYSPVMDENGRPVGVIAIVVETTERVLAERRNAEGRRRLIQMFEQAPTFMAMLSGPEHRFDFVNPGYMRLVGHREILGLTVAEALPDAAEQGYVALLDEAFATGRSITATGARYAVQSEPGGPAAERYVDFVYQPLVESDGRCTGIFVEGIDVTDRVEAEMKLTEARDMLETEVAARTAELKASQQLLRTIFETSFGFQGLLSTDGVLLDANATSLEAIGADLADVVGKPFAETPWFSGSPGVSEVIRRSIPQIAAGQVVRREMLLNLPVGGWRWYDCAMRPMRDESGQVVAILPEAIETTERRAAEEALRQSQKLEAMGQLTGGVAHDFNNLLTPIIGSLDMLHRQKVGTERQQRLINGGLQSAERAKTLVQRLLAFARRQPLQPRPVDVAALIGDMRGLILSTTGPRIRVDFNLGADLPAATAEANQLEMALLNLAVNARDAMPDGGVLTISARRDEMDGSRRLGLKPGGYIRIGVEDSGMGMDAETLARAIEPFFSTKGIGKGTGLGLSMVHGLASQLGGAIDIVSHPGDGTCIELWLPVSATPVDTAVAGHESNGDAPLGTALLVDDDELVRASTADMLTELGYHVIEAESADQALGLVHSAEIALVVTDHMMPGMTGTELAMAIRIERPTLPVLLISGFAEADGIAPDQPRLTKPFRSSDLAATLSTLAV